MQNKDVNFIPVSTYSAVATKHRRVTTTLQNMCSSCVIEEHTYQSREVMFGRYRPIPDFWKDKYDTSASIAIPGKYHSNFSCADIAESNNSQRRMVFDTRQYRRVFAYVLFIKIKSLYLPSINLYGYKIFYRYISYKFMHKSKYISSIFKYILQIKN
jgi:hypothetical protein